MRRSLKNSRMTSGFALQAALLALAACGGNQAAKKDSKDKGGNTTENATATPPHVDPHAAVQAVSPPGAPTEQKEFRATEAYGCDVKKTPNEFVTDVAHDLFRRTPTDEEQKLAAAKDFEAAKFVDWALDQPDRDSGVAYFISNLLRIEQNLKLQGNKPKPEEIAQLTDLKQEPVVLAQRFFEKPWTKIFDTNQIYCTKNTAPLYDFPMDPNTQGWVPCKMQPERAGLLGLVSTLRGFASAFYLVNSNRNRVALAMYLVKGIQLQAATNGPGVEGRPDPLVACTFQGDMRVANTGQIFGGAAVPESNKVCAGCHRNYLQPVETAAFGSFDMDGRIINTSDVDRLNANMLQGIPTEELKRILVYGQDSCWNPDDLEAPWMVYRGLPGFARLIAGSKSLSFALAVQLQLNLRNKDIDDNVTESIRSNYDDKGKSLKAALRGLFLADAYQCAKKK